MKKKIKIVIFISFIFILLFNLNYTYGETNEEKDEEQYSEVYKEWLQLPEEDKNNSIPPLPFNIRYEQNEQGIFNSLKSSNPKAKYDLREDISVVVKNQNATGECWAFASNSMLETYLQLHNETWNFSERHLDYATSENYINGINKNALNRNVGYGGYNTISGSYYTRGLGPILEENMPFENNENSINIEELPENIAVKKVDDIIYFPSLYKKVGENGNIEYTDGNYSTYTLLQVNEMRKEIKNHIVEYGGIVTSIHAPSGDGFYNYNSFSAYVPVEFANSNGIVSNHAVTIIGWDDNYSKDNFSIKPKSNGAYIALNSWGDYWGNMGIYYISYEDYYVEGNLMGTRGVSDIKYDKLYQYDEYEMLSSTYTKYGANVYTATDDEVLTEIMVGALSNQKCNVYFSIDTQDLNINNSMLIASNVLLHPGYNTIEANNISISAGTKFAIIVEISDGTYGGQIATEWDRWNQYGNATTPIQCNPGESFKSRDGITWSDICDRNTDSTYQRNFVIKAYTKARNDFLNVSEVNGQLYSNYSRKINLKLNTTYINNGKNVKITILKNGVDVTNTFTVTGKRISGNSAFILISNPNQFELGEYTVKIKVEGYDEVERYFSIESYNSNIYRSIGFSDLSFFKYMIKKIESVKDVNDCDGVMYSWKTATSPNAYYRISISEDIFNRITSIEAEKEFISSIEGIQYFTNLQSINLKLNAISDISYLSNLKNVKELNLELNNITDITVLSELNNLEYLNLSFNNLDNINTISANLKELYLKGISQENIDISRIFQLNKLEKLDLSANKWISDQELQNITYLTNLKFLGLNACNINNLNFLKNVRLSELEIGNPYYNLYHYYVSSTGDNYNFYIKSYSYINGNNSIIDFSPLFNNSNLTYLNISYLNTIENLDFLENIKSLNRFIYTNGVLKDATALDKEELLTKEWKTLDLEYHSFYSTITINSFDEEKIAILPPIFSQALDENSKLFSSKGIELIDCEWYEEGKSVILDNNYATVIILDGPAVNSSYSISVKIDAREYLSEEGKRRCKETSFEEYVLIFNTEDDIICGNVIENCFVDLSDDIEFEVWDDSWNWIDNDNKLGSYNYIVLYGLDGYIAQYTIAVKGDVSGDGNLGLFDAFKILIGTLTEQELSEIDILIRDFNDDGVVSLYDAFKFLIKAIQQG